MLFVLDEWRNFFSVAHFNAANLVFSARFGAVFYFVNFGFCSTTYDHPLSHLSLLAFVTFVFFTLRCRLFFILRRRFFPFINSCAFSYCLSFLLPDEASGRNVVNSTVFCSTVCCSLIYYTSILLVLHQCRNCSLLRTSVEPFSSLVRPSVLPPAAETLSSVQPPTFVRFLTFLYWLLSLLNFSQFAVAYFFIRTVEENFIDIV